MGLNKYIGDNKQENDDVDKTIEVPCDPWKQAICKKVSLAKPECKHCPINYQRF